MARPDGSPLLRFNILTVAIAVALVAILHFSWTVFWMGSVALLTFAAYSASHPTTADNGSVSSLTRTESIWLISLGLAAAVLTLAMSRSDLDDAYYVSAAAYTASHPHAPLLLTDPMFGESTWPLLFPSYRFSAFEPLAAAIANVLGIPAMDVVYKLFPPLSAIVIVCAVFFCMREIVPRRWIVAGTFAIALMMVLGEEHRSAANFGFVRAFQGKALFLSVMVPLIYGLSFRYVSGRGRRFDLFLLVCAQIASIGLSNFAILCAPMTGAVAAASASPPFSRSGWRKFAALVSTTCVALPYLIFVAVQSHDASSFSQFNLESAPAVWVGVFGQHQQYFVALLFLLAPFAAHSSTLRWRMALPPLIMLGVLLNPFLASWISRYLTSPPVYWRVTWTFPALIYLGVALSLLFDRLSANKQLVSATGAAAAIALPLAATTIPYNIFRSVNHVTWQFASRKLDAGDALIAERAIALTDDGRVLANDSISGVIAMHENHPLLVNVRSSYLDLLAKNMPHAEYEDRKLLTQFASEEPASDSTTFKPAVDRLHVNTIVLAIGNPTYDMDLQVLKAAGFSLKEQSESYAIWTRNIAP